MLSTSPQKRLIFNGSLAFVLFIAVATGLVLWLRDNRLAFDSNVWKRDNLEAYAHKKFTLSDATRDRMVFDLLDHYHLNGMTRTEIVNLLGEPDFKKKEIFKDWDMLYWLGPDARGLVGALDFKWLLLRLDSTGKVTEYKAAGD